MIEAAGWSKIQVKEFLVQSGLSHSRRHEVRRQISPAGIRQTTCGWRHASAGKGRPIAPGPYARRYSGGHGRRRCGRTFLLYPVLEPGPIFLDAVEAHRRLHRLRLSIGETTCNSMTPPSRAPSETSPARPPSDDLDGKTVGILENGKLNAVNMLRETAILV